MSIMLLSALFCTFTISKLKMKTHNTCLLFEIWKIQNSKIITHNLTTWRLLSNVSTHFFSSVQSLTRVQLFATP